jgi:cytoskeletal protein CcmA (bactofilin family)
MTPTSKITSNVEITGTMKFKGELLFEGKFNGDRIEGNDLVMGEHAEVRAKNLVLDNLTTAGLVEGDADVSARCYLKATAHLQGSLKTFRLAMDDGATFSGGLVISKPANIAPLKQSPNA